MSNNPDISVKAHVRDDSEITIRQISDSDCLSFGGDGYSEVAVFLAREDLIRLKGVIEGYLA